MITRRRAALAVGLGLLLAGALAARRLEPSVGLQALSLVAPDGSSIPALRIRPLDPRQVRGHALLLHGVTASKETLVPFAEALALTGLDCLTVDFPGHGESTVGFGDRAGLISTAMAAAKFAAPGEPLDVVVGHSMGAYVAADALAAGQLHARRFIALGAAADPGEAKTSSLFLAGRWDEVVSGASLTRLAAAQPGRAAAFSSLSDHVVEPFDPLLITQAVPSASPRTAWLVRLLGIAALGAGFLVLLWTLTPVASRTPAQLGVGALAFVATALTYARGFGGVWLNATPNLQRLAMALALAFAAAVGLGILTRVAAALPLLRRLPATVALGVAMLGLFVALLGLLVIQQRFLAMCAGWSLLLFAGLAVLCGIVEHRSRSRLAAVVCSSAFLGYFLGQWIPLL